MTGLREIAEAVNAWMVCGLAAAAGCLAVGYAALLAVGACRAWRRTPAAAALALAAAWTLYVGGTKPVRLSVTWDEGLHDAGSSVSTNDACEVTIRWTYEQWIPPVSTVTVSAMPIGSTNLAEVASAPIADLAVTARMDMAATNYAYLVTHSYVPEPAVRTNGVYHIDCFDTTNRVWVPRGVVITRDGVPVSYDPDAEPPTLDAATQELIVNALEGIE